MIFVAHFSILFSFKARNFLTILLYVEFVFVHRALTIFIMPAVSPRQQPITACNFTGSNLCHIISFFKQQFYLKFVASVIDHHYFHFSLCSWRYLPVWPAGGDWEGDWEVTPAVKLFTLENLFADEQGPTN